MLILELVSSCPMKQKRKSTTEETLTTLFEVSFLPMRFFNFEVASFFNENLWFKNCAFEMILSHLPKKKKKKKEKPNEKISTQNIHIRPFYENKSTTASLKNTLIKNHE